MSNTNSKLSDQILESVNTVSDALRNISGVKDVDIATAPRTTVWEDGKVKLYHFEREGKAMSDQVFQQIIPVRVWAELTH